MYNTIEELNNAIAAITNEQLISHAENEISKLAKSGGLSHRMRVPPEPTDTDMLLSELLNRFKRMTSLNVDTLVKEITDKNKNNPNAFFQSGVLQGINAVLSSANHSL